MALPPVTRDGFLNAVHADAELQQALQRTEVAAVAARIASAAGLDVRAIDLIARPDSPEPQGLEGEACREGEGIDFDGDGVPDAVWQGGRWVMSDSEE